jgi:arsenate reductase-like glutaredoxin family protein
VIARDFFREPFTEEELRSLLGGRSPAQAFAWRSPRARALGLDPSRPPAEEELLRLMLEVPYLIRRPIVRLDDQVFFGFDPKALAAALDAGE